MPTEVTDPAVLAQLNGTDSDPKEVTDPDVLAKLNAPDDTSATEETTGRIAGLGARALSSGVAHLAGIPQMAVDAMNPMAAGVRNAAEAQSDAASGPYKPSLADFVHPERWQKAAEYFAEKGSNAAGLPTPTTDAERIGSKAVEALPSGILAPEAPIAAGLSAAAGSAASEGTKAAGYGPVAQTAAGLLGGSGAAMGAGLAGATRAIARGGADGQAAMQSRLADAASSGTNLDAGQATGSKLLQYLTGASSKLWGGSPIEKNAESQSHAIGSYVDHIVENLSGPSTPSPMSAGDAITKGIGTNQAPGTAFGNMRKAERAAYDKVDQMVPPDHPVDVSSTLAKLASLTKPTPGAQKTTGSLIPSQISEMYENMLDDVTANGAAATPNLPYKAATALKEHLGNSIDWGFSPSNPKANGALKQIHSTLKDDIDNGAAAVSPQAEQAVKDARALYAKNQETRESLQPIIDRAGGPEAVYQAATNGTKLGATKIQQVMTAIKPDQQNLVRATVLDRLGRATPSAQNAQGTAFNPGTFLTNWNKLDPNAKDALFGAGGTTGSLRNNLDSLSRTISNIRSGTKLRNPSGTGEAVGHGAGMIALWEGLTHALAGHPGTLAATGGGFVANNILARSLTNPKVVGWLAKSTKAPISSLPNAVNQLSKVNDPDAQALASYLNPPAPISRASGGKVDHEALVVRLIRKWKEAKKETNKTTEPLLKLPDAAIVKALDIAGRAV